MLPVIAVLTFLAVALAAWVLLSPRDDTVRRRIIGDAPPGGSHNGVPPFPLAPRGTGRRVGRLLPDAAHLLPPGIGEKLLVANSRLSPAQFLAVWAGSVLVGVWLLVYVVQSNPGLLLTQQLTAALAILFPFVLGPYAWLRRRAKNRQQAITRALPDALDLLVTGVEAGLGTDAAFSLVAEKTGGPLADVFALYLRQVGLGQARREAFAAVARQAGVPDLQRVAAAVIQAEQMGTALGEALRIQADDLRTLRRLRAQEAAQRAPVLMTIPMALCFLPAMVAVVIVPSVLNLMDFVGRLGR